MAEFDPRRSPWNEGLSISPEIISLDLYRLLCIFHASRSINSTESISIPLLCKNFQEAEVGRLLISIASAIRNACDQKPSRAEYWKESLNSDKVGDLIPNLKSPDETGPLSFREACNKIIHCDTLNFDYCGKEPRRQGSQLAPIVYLYGVLKKRIGKRLSI